MRGSLASQRLAGFIGNVLEHYDTALFGMLAPFIAPLFFAQKDPLTGLILTYGMIPLGILSKPVGSLFFGWIGDKWGRKHALFLSLMLIAVTTMSIGFLPTFAEVGVLSPLLLAATRIMQSFCAAGESSGGAIFVLEHTEKKKKSLVSSFYDASTIAGILLASAGVVFLNHFGWIEKGWRYLFWAGSLTALIGVMLRLRTEEGEEFLKDESHHHSLKEAIRLHRLALVAIIFVSGFSYVIYALAVTLMNGYLPLVTSLTPAEVVGPNTLLLLFDFCLLPFFGLLAMRISNEKVMLLAAASSVIASIPLFTLLEGATWGVMIGVRICLITLGVAFSAPYHAWVQELVPPSCRYTIISLGYAIGSQVIGAPAPALSIWLYKTLGWVAAPALYLVVTGSLAFFAVYRLGKRRQWKEWPVARYQSINSSSPR
jgi:MFS family permease